VEYSYLVKKLRRLTVTDSVHMGSVVGVTKLIICNVLLADQWIPWNFGEAG